MEYTRTTHGTIFSADVRISGGQVIFHYKTISLLTMLILILQNSKLAVLPWILCALNSNAHNISNGNVKHLNFLSKQKLYV